MYKNYIVFILLVIISCNQKPKEISIQKKSTTPLQKTEINFTEEMHNFGKLISGEIVIHTFEFTNSGDHDFILEKVNSDCGCIKTNFKKNPIKPGQTGLIEIEFDSSGMFGKQFKTLEVYGNCKELKHLAIFAEVKNEMIQTNN